MFHTVPDTGATTSPAIQPARLGEILCRRGLLDDAALNRALEAQRLSGAPLGQVLRQTGVVSARDITGALAEQTGRIRIDIARMRPDADLADGLDASDMIRLGFVPWRRQGSALIVAASTPQNIPAIREILGPRPGGLAFVLAEPDQIDAAIMRSHGPAIAERTRERCPEDQSCRGWASSRRGLRFRVSLAILAFLTILKPGLILVAAMLWIIGFNLATTGLRFFALIRSFIPDPPAPRREPVLRRGPATLPMVSIMIPLLREEIVLRDLIAALGRTSYPKELLDIILVLEADDMTTPIALSRLDLPPWMRVIRTPADSLKTKPRAMNYALEFCRGSIVGVYDAEDRPEPNQIHKIVDRFQRTPRTVACLQGYLDFYNTRQNWLSRCFTVEYAIWFRVLLKGVQSLGMPIPLGGTTVFFRRDALEEVGAWDSHNVTEDADLGMRLARRGYRTEMVPTTTMEEANCHALPWIHQRSRWLKGYAITWATHMRQPVTLWTELGPRGFFGFQLILLGGLTAYLSAPMMWILWGLWLGFDLRFVDMAPGWIWTGFFGSMILGQAVMMTVAMRAVWRPGRRHLVWTVPTLGLYWPLGAMAAYRAMFEVISKPFYWAKTRHGL